MITLLIGLTLAQPAPGNSLAERWAAAKLAYNESEVLRLDTLLKDAGKKSRQTKGVERQQILAQISAVKKRLSTAKSGRLPPMLRIGAYSKGAMGYLVEDPTADQPKLARARIILFMDAIPILGQSGFKCMIGADTVIVEAKTDAQSLQIVELNSPVEVVGTYKDLGGIYYVLRPFTPPAEKPPSKPERKRA